MAGRSHLYIDLEGNDIRELKDNAKEWYGMPLYLSDTQGNLLNTGDSVAIGWSGSCEYEMKCTLSFFNDNSIFAFDDEGIRLFDMDYVLSASKYTVTKEK